MQSKHKIYTHIIKSFFFISKKENQASQKSVWDMFLVWMSWGTVMLANWTAFTVCVRNCSDGTRWLSVFHFTEGFLWTTETWEVDRNIRTHPIAVAWTQGFWVWWEFSCPSWAWSKDVWSQTTRVDNPVTTVAPGFVVSCQWRLRTQTLMIVGKQGRIDLF